MVQRGQPTAAQLAGIISIAADAIIAADAEQRITFFNEGAEQIFGYRSTEVMGEPLELLLPERFRAGHAGHLRAFGAEAGAAARLMGERHEIAGRRKSGEEFPAEASISKVEGEAGPLFAVVLRDVTERKRWEANERRLIEERVARAAAESSEQRVRVLAEAGEILTGSLEHRAVLVELADFLTRTVADYAVTYLLEEDGMIRRVAARHADPAMKNVVEDLLALYPPRLEDPFGAGAAMRTRLPILARDIDDELLQRSAQDRLHLQILLRLRPRSSIVAPLVARGRVIGALAAATTDGGRPQYDEADKTLLTELARRAALAVDNARLLLEAHEGNRAKAKFLATISHELRTPLNAIFGYADLLVTGTHGEINEKQRQSLGRIMISARHLVTLIEEILQFTRLEASRETARLEEANVALVAREAADMARPAIGARGLSLDVVLPADTVTAHTDAGRVRQILVNLLDNATKFTEEGTIRLELGTLPDGVALRVADSGIGIAPEHLERIFEPFWQVDQGITRRVGGTGLGLAVSRRLARLLGGELTVASTLGLGSIFTLTLPVSGSDG